MTISGCTAGSNRGGSNNLSPKRILEFTKYIVNVLKSIKDEHKIVFQTVEPFNEPHKNHIKWEAGSGQEV